MLACLFFFFFDFWLLGLLDFQYFCWLLGFGRFGQLTCRGKRGWRDLSANRSCRAGHKPPLCPHIRINLASLSNGAGKASTSACQRMPAHASAWPERDHAAPLQQVGLVKAIHACHCPRFNRLNTFHGPTPPFLAVTNKHSGTSDGEFDRLVRILPALSRSRTLMTESSSAAAAASLHAARMRLQGATPRALGATEQHVPLERVVARVCRAAGASRHESGGCHCPITVAKRFAIDATIVSSADVDGQGPLWNRHPAASRRGSPSPGQPSKSAATSIPNPCGHGDASWSH